MQYVRAIRVKSLKSAVEYKMDTSKILNMIWTAGFNAGIKAQDEINRGLIKTKEEL